MKVSYFFYALALQVASVMAAPADEANQLRTDKTDALQKDTSLAAQGQLLGSDVQERCIPCSYPCNGYCCPESSGYCIYYQGRCYCPRR